MYDLTNQM